MVIEPQRFPWFLDISLDITMCYIALWSSRGVISDSNLKRPRIGWSFQDLPCIVLKDNWFRHGFSPAKRAHHMGFPAQGPRPNRTPWWRGARLGYTALIGVYRISPHFYIFLHGVNEDRWVAHCFSKNHKLKVTKRTLRPSMTGAPGAVL